MGIKIKMFLLVVFAVFLFSGCGREEVSEEYLASYQGEQIIFPDAGEQEAVFGMACKSGRAAFIRRDGTEKKRCHIYEMDTESGQINKLDLEDSVEEKVFYTLAYGSDGSLYLLSAEQDGKAFYIDVIEPDEMVKGRMDVTSLMEQYFASDTVFLKADENNIYLIGMFGTVILNMEGEAVYQEENLLSLQKCYQDKDGEITILRWNEKEKWDGYFYDGEKQELVKKGEFFVQDFQNVLDGRGEYDYYYICTDAQNGTGNNIVGVKDGRKFLLCKIEETGLDGQKCKNSIQAAGRDCFVSLYTDDIGQTSAVFIKKADGDAVGQKERIQLNLAGLNIDWGIRNAITRFNAGQSELYVNAMDFLGMYADRDEALRQMNLRLTGKRDVDVICLGGLSTHDLVKKDMLTDLNRFFEESGEMGKGLQKEELLDSVVNACSDESGRIYYLYPEIYLKSLLQKDGNGRLSLSYMEEAKNGLKEGQKLFFTSDKTTILCNFVQYNPEGLIDYDKGVCKFDCPYFRELLTFIKEIPEENAKEDSLPEAVRENKVLFFDGDIELILDYMLFTQMCDGDVNFLGYPTQKGVGTVMDCMAGGIGILSESEKQEQAWQFLSFLLGKEHYGEMFGIYYLPVRKDSMADAVEKMSAEESYTKEDGTEILAVDNYKVGYEDYEVTPAPLKEADIQILNRLLDNAVSCDKMEEKYMDIIIEEAMLYFSGQQAIDDTVLHIEKRVGTALGE